jgi:hypothetical protein
MFDVGYTDTKAFRTIFKKITDLRRWNIGISIINKHFREPSIVNRESVTATIGARILTLNFFPGWNLLTTHFRES